MAAPHRKDRYGETWDPAQIAALSTEIHKVREWAVISGGWAWHYMSPPHAEYKHAHDHKDVDLLIPRRSFAALMAAVQAAGYQREWTRFDGLTPDFYRYATVVPGGGRPVKVLFDIFVEDAPWVETPSGMRVVEPGYLLSLYGKKHSSDLCFSVQIARDLVRRGENPVGHPAMAEFGRFFGESG
ncbi:MAG TPA: hypothetical protein VFJ58_16215 [Armatimonadota bacterium]|nr:hypothetical protein [Armatimonadota bacterium]